MRFIPHTEADVAAMLQTIGVAHIDDLIAHVPENLRKSAAIKLTAGRTEAEVAAETLSWRNQEVPCFRIDYREPGKRVTARTWVRRQDGLVLRQEAEHLGKELILERDRQAP